MAGWLICKDLKLNFNRISKTHLLFNWSRGLWSRRPVGIYHKAPISPFLPKDPTFLSAANHFTFASHFTIISHFAITSHFSLYTFIWFEELGITHFATEKLHILIYPPSLASEKRQKSMKIIQMSTFSHLTKKWCTFVHLFSKLTLDREEKICLLVFQFSL